MNYLEIFRITFDSNVIYLKHLKNVSLSKDVVKRYCKNMYIRVQAWVELWDKCVRSGNKNDIVV